MSGADRAGEGTAKPLRILVLSQYYAPEEVIIPTTLARGLAARGHSVKVLTGFPSYPRGEIFEGHHQRWRSREADGPVDVLRVPLWIDHSTSAVRRIANYASFALSATTAGRYAAGADVVYVYATQMTPALAPWLWRMLGGAPYVLHVQDLWPDSILGSSLVGRGLASRLIDALLTPWIRAVYRSASAVVGIAPTMVETLVQRGCDPESTVLVMNWSDDSVAASPSAEPRVDHEGTHVLYAGNVGDLQDLETAVRAVHRAADAGVRLTILGDGVARSRIRALADELGARNVEFVDPVPRSEVASHYARADFALVSLKDLPVFRGTIPSKFQGALAHGTPVISSVPGDLARWIESNGVGFAAPPEDVAGLESALRRATGLDPAEYAAMVGRGQESYARSFSVDSGVVALERVLGRASQRERPSKVRRQQGERQ